MVAVVNVAENSIVAFIAINCCSVAGDNVIIALAAVECHVVDVVVDSVVAVSRVD